MYSSWFGNLLKIKDWRPFFFRILLSQNRHGNPGIPSLSMNITSACKGLPCPPRLCPTMNRLKRDALWMCSLRLNWVSSSKVPFDFCVLRNARGFSEYAKKKKKSYLDSFHMEAFGLALNFILLHHC